MLLETLKLKIGNLAHQYLMGLPPENIQGTYNVAMYGPDSLLAAVDIWIEKEGKRLKKISGTEEQE